MPIQNSVRPLLKNCIPQYLVRGMKTIRRVLQRPRLEDPRSIFFNAVSEPEYLGVADLEFPQAKYPPLPEYGYDPRSTERRGFRRPKNSSDFPQQIQQGRFSNLAARME
jgi:hypothetical protein